jgi:flagellar motor switch protein FliN
MPDNTENEKTQSSETKDKKVFSNPENQEDANSKVEAGIADFENFEESNQRDINTDGKLQFLKDLQLNVFIELGRTQMQIKDILELERGYVIELDKLASEPVDVFVNNKKIAEGEVVVIDKHFGIRITNLNEGSQRLKDLY